MIQVKLTDHVRCIEDSNAIQKNFVRLKFLLQKEKLQQQSCCHSLTEMLHSFFPTTAIMIKYS